MKRSSSKLRYRRLLDFYAGSDATMAVEFRPNKKRSDGEWICAHRAYPEESWSFIKRIDIDAKLLRTMRENPDLERGRLPDIYRVGRNYIGNVFISKYNIQVTNEGNFFIGIDPAKSKCVVTDRNPHFELLLDIHKCCYLPSSFEKNQNLPRYLTQNILLMELPSPVIHCAGVSNGKFLITPKLQGCNIFVAHDPTMHKFWVLRISSKRPEKPPDIDKEIGKDAEDSGAGQDIAESSKSLSKEAALKTNLQKRVPVQKSKAIERQRAKSMSPVKRKNNVTVLRNKRFLQVKRPVLKSKSEGEEEEVGGETQQAEDWAKVDILSPRNRFNRPNNARLLLRELAKINKENRLLHVSHSRIKDFLQAGFPYACVTLMTDSTTGFALSIWRPPTPVRQARQKEIEATRKPKSYAQHFREYRAYAECVLDYLRTQGYNANLIVRIATDRNWITDVIDQKFWIEEMDSKHRCNHYMYRGEAVFYGIVQDGDWKFGLKDLHTTLTKSGVMHRYPLTGQDYFYHKTNCKAAKEVENTRGARAS